MSFIYRESESLLGHMTGNQVRVESLLVIQRSHLSGSEKAVMES
jgi:hypothetical protein